MSETQEILLLLWSRGVMSGGERAVAAAPSSASRTIAFRLYFRNKCCFAMRGPRRELWLTLLSHHYTPSLYQISITFFLLYHESATLDFTCRKSW